MVRPSQLRHAPRAIAPTRDAATLLLLRDGPQGLEVLMTRRSTQASFAPGAYVFPGGGIDPTDALALEVCQRRAGQSEALSIRCLAAIRESLEELGVLLAYRADGQWADASDVLRFDRQAPLAEQCRQMGYRLAVDGVFYLAHWITDRDLPRRFDVPFLVARMPAGQTPVADEKEQFEPVWVRPSEALERHRAGDFFMIFPTIRTLERLQTHLNVESVLQACASDQPWFTSCPRAGWRQGHEERFMEHEAAYGELALTCPDGQIAHELAWQHDQPVALLNNLQRLTCGNPSVMTGPGTNSYVVGDPDTGHIVIDPGPHDSAHLERLWRVAGGDVRLIVCTHSHPDHSPGARPLQALCEQHGQRPAILGLSSMPTAREASHFVPDRELADGERLVLSGAGSTHTLRVLHTPGHAANHVCLILEEDGLLFSGDHVLNGSTTVIDPPDGHMGDYIRSLDALLAACESDRIEFILPAHGHVLGNLDGGPYDAADVIRRLKAHRLQREAKIMRVMQNWPQGSMQDWVERAYDDVPPRLWPVAMRSLTAHVERIRELDAFKR
jgi:glyoxylase-like metal-dependent hydrolase (beta-lactamase superfamily II)/8-oxo-dGTP pyrophosphatase MutT (NUDIX family)